VFWLAPAVRAHTPPRKRTNHGFESQEHDAVLRHERGDDARKEQHGGDGEHVKGEGAALIGCRAGVQLREGREPNAEVGEGDGAEEGAGSAREEREMEGEWFEMEDEEGRKRRERITTTHSSRL
jgi:hypothetical protein